MAEMSSMNVSLPARMKSWVEEKANSGQYSNTSDYVRDLIRRDQERDTKIVHMQKLVDAARASGVSSRSLDEIRAEGRRQAGIDV